MKLSLNWLREWVELPEAPAAIAQKLTMAGIEAEAAPVLAAPLPHVVVGRIVSLAPHPNADRLRVCSVDAGEGTPRTIVCGAPNAEAGRTAIVALPGARLPNGMEIKTAAVRGVESAGMLCSAQELGLAEKSEGLLYLDPQAKIGQPLGDHLKLDDSTIALELTPNRGDCLGVRGLARELAAIHGRTLREPVQAAAAVNAGVAVRKVGIEKAADCSCYLGREISGIDARARTPDWMRERLRRSGIRAIHPLVDITNIVMLELGQPMHAFDSARLHGAVQVRRARAGEALTLLNDQALTLTGADLVIADEKGPVALAGVMGGRDSAVDDHTTAVFLESACFLPLAVAGTGRRHKLASDAVYRFERGVDPALQRRALERCTQLILEICGGKAGAISVAGDEKAAAAKVALRQARMDALLGFAIPPAEAEGCLRGLGVAVEKSGEGWLVQAPTWRYDLRIEPDFIEEVVRLHGYDRIPLRADRPALVPPALPEARRASTRVREQLVARGWFEAVTYSFVDPRIQQALAPDATAIRVDNPIADTLSLMRTTLWSGLLPAWQYNRQRQQNRVRLFEIGSRYAISGERILETPCLAGIAAGPRAPEQWGEPAQAVDFYDLKGDLEALMPGAVLRWSPACHPALHPGRSAELAINGLMAGWLGALHPAVVQALDLSEAPWVFELRWDAVEAGLVPTARPVPEFPSSRRDLALVVPESVTAEALVDAARAAAGARLVQILPFDVFRGGALPNGCKSVALGLIFQDYSRTLTDTEVDEMLKAVRERLEGGLGAAVRS